MAAWRAFARSAVALWLLTVLASCSLVWSAKAQQQAAPLQRVIEALREMESRAEAQGKEEAKVHEKFMCFCERNEAELRRSVAEAEEKLPLLKSTIDELVATIRQQEQDIKAASNEMAVAEESLKEQSEVRHKEQSAFDIEAASLRSNLASVAKALLALKQSESNGRRTIRGTVLLEADTIGRIHRLSQSAAANRLSRADREVLLELDQNGAPPEDSSMIIGVLQKLEEDMQHDLQVMIEANSNKQAEFDALTQSKRAELETVQLSTRDRRAHSSGNQVRLAQLRDDAAATGKALESDRRLLEKLLEDCAKHRQDHEAAERRLQEELAAVRETVKLLTDEAVSALFRRTLAQPASFLQTNTAVHHRHGKQQVLRRSHESRGLKRKGTLTSAAMTSKTSQPRAGLAKLADLVGNMMALVEKEQEEDELKTQMCNEQMNKQVDRKAALHESSKMKATDITTMGSELEASDQDLVDLRRSIADLDRAVADSKEQRKEEHNHFMQELLEGNAALEVLGSAKRRLSRLFGKHAPANTAEGKAEEATNTDGAASTPGPVQIMQMLDTIEEDMRREFQGAQEAEAASQKEYEQFVATATQKRLSYTQALAERAGTHAELQSRHVQMHEQQKALHKEIKNAERVIADLHLECDDWIRNLDVRRAARKNQQGALRRMRDVLTVAA